MIYIVNALKGKVFNIQEQMGNLGREIKTLIKNLKKMLESLNTTTEMNNALDSLSSRTRTHRKDIVRLESQQKYTNRQRNDRGKIKGQNI